MAGRNCSCPINFTPPRASTPKPSSRSSTSRLSTPTGNRKNGPKSTKQTVSKTTPSNPCLNKEQTSKPHSTNKKNVVPLSKSHKAETQTKGCPLECSTRTQISNPCAQTKPTKANESQTKGCGLKSCKGTQSSNISIQISNEQIPKTHRTETQCKCCGRPLSSNLSTQTSSERQIPHGKRTETQPTKTCLECCTGTHSSNFTNSERQISKPCAATQTSKEQATSSYKTETQRKGACVECCLSKQSNSERQIHKQCATKQTNKEQPPKSYKVETQHKRSPFESNRKTQLSNTSKQTNNQRPKQTNRPYKIATQNKKCWKAPERSVAPKANLQKTSYTVRQYPCKFLLDSQTDNNNFDNAREPSPFDKCRCRRPKDGPASDKCDCMTVSNKKQGAVQNKCCDASVEVSASTADTCVATCNTSYQEIQTRKDSSDCISCASSSTYQPKPMEVVCSNCRKQAKSEPCEIIIKICNETNSSTKSDINKTSSCGNKTKNTLNRGSTWHSLLSQESFDSNASCADTERRCLARTITE